MATIPMGNFGQQVARAAPAQRVLQGDPAGDAVQRVGQQAFGIAGDMARADFELQQKQQRADASLALVKAQNQLHDAHDEVARGVMDGTIPAEKADGEFTKAAGKVRESVLGGYQADQRATMDAHISGVEGSLQRGLQGVVFKRKQQETASTIDQFGEQVSREAMRQGPAWASQKFGAMVDFTGSAAGLNEAQQQKLKQSFAERVHATFFEGAGVAALTKGDIPALQSLREQLNGSQGDALDPGKRTALSHQLFTWQKQIEGSRAREQDAAEKLAADTVNKLQTFILEGQAPDLEYQKQVLEATKGTQWEAQAKAQINLGIQGAGFGSQPLLRQAAMMQTWEGTPTDPDQAKARAHARTIHERQAAAYKEDPWDAAARFQRMPVVVAQPIMAPGQLLQLATQRIPQMGGIEAASGMPAPLLRPAEVPQAIQVLQSASIRDRVEVLGQIGSMLKAPQIEALAAQLESGNKPLALTLKLGADRTTTGRMTSELVQIGAQALADKTVKKDDTALAGWRAEISSLVRGTLGDTKAENDIIDAAYFVRAAQELDGVAPTGFKLPVGADQAVSLVVGMPLTRAGVKTLLPRGMDESMFDTRARAALAAGKGQTIYLRGQPMTVESLANRWPSYGVRMVRPGEYMPVSGNAPFTLDKEGAVPLRVQVR